MDHWLLHDFFLPLFEENDLLQFLYAWLTTEYCVCGGGGGGLQIIDLFNPQVLSLRGTTIKEHLPRLDVI